MRADKSLYRDESLARPSMPKPSSAVMERNRTAPPLIDETLEIFVMRVSNRAFKWQVRRFGAIVVQEGQQTYSTAELARQAGEAALATGT